MNKKVAVAVLIAAASFFAGARAQNPDITPGQFVSTNPCKTVMSVSAPGQAKFCFGSDGAWTSVNGSAVTQFAPAPAVVSAGVTSWNGLTGAVTFVPPPAPVTSVNGKTGPVVLTLQ